MPLPVFTVAANPVRWAEYLPFVQASGHRLPPHVVRRGSGWQCTRWGQAAPLDEREPACHLSQRDAAAWCAWPATLQAARRPAATTLSGCGCG